MRRKSFLICVIVMLVLVMVGCGVAGSAPATGKNGQGNVRDESKKQVEIVTEYINLRKDSNTNSEILGKVQTSEVYTVLDTNGQWIKIKTASGTTGWIITSYNGEAYVQYLAQDGVVPSEQENVNAVTGEYVDNTENPRDSFRQVEWISDIPLNDIKCIKDDGMMEIQEKQFISKSGDLYVFSTDKLYSNEQVCKKVETDLKFDRFYMGPDDRELSIAITNDGDGYKYIHEVFYDDVVAWKYSEVMLKEHPHSYGVYDWGAINYYIYYYVKDNQLYEYKIELRYEEPGDIVLHDMVIDAIPDGETVIGIEGMIFVTDKAFYKVGVVNQADVDKYEDVKPIYGLVRLEDVQQMRSEIAYFNGNYIIFKDDTEHLYIY